MVLVEVQIGKVSINKEKFSPNSPFSPTRISLLKLMSSHASCLIKPFSSFSELTE